MRKAEINRKTQETDVVLSLSLDGTGKSEISTGVGFLDHMLTLFASHARFDLAVKATGDIHVDAHHTVEDVGICLGRAFSEALGSKKGITRYGDITLPMDEALVLAAVDISGRAHLGYALSIGAERVGSFDTELVEEFWLAFVRNADCSLHLRSLAGTNAHHVIEGAFKAAARALRRAVAIDPALEDEIPSTKGVL